MPNVCPPGAPGTRSGPRSGIHLTARHRLAVHGLRYHVSDGGAGREGTPPVLLVHGFTGRDPAWDRLARTLRRTRRVLVVDLPGHGRTDTPASPVRASVEATADDLARLLHLLDAGPADVIGYSLGGRIALRLALTHPAAVRRLVLEGAGAGIADPLARAARQAHDEQLARRIEQEGVAAFVACWETLPLFAGERALPAATQAARRARRLRHTAAGLAASLRGAGQGAQEPLHARLGDLLAHTLLVVGARDPAAHARATEIAARAPRARTAVVSAAGHAVHLERAAEFRHLVTQFLDAPPFDH